MIKIYVWRPMKGFKLSRYYNPELPEERQHRRRGVGHVSLMLISGSENFYISYWPDDDAIHKSSAAYFALALSAFNSRLTHSLGEDIDRMECIPNEIVELSKLDEAEISAFWHDLPTKYQSYRLYGKNCSDIVLATLHTGAANVKPSLIEKATLLAGKALPVLNTAARLLLLYHSDSDISMNQQEKQWIMENAFEGIAPAELIFSLYEVFGGQTPESVLRYAKFLKQKIG